MREDEVSASRRIAFSFPADPRSIGDVRHLILAEARTLPFSEEDLDDIALAVSEAYTNLIQHAHTYRIRGVCEVMPDALEVRFEIEQAPPNYLGKTQLPAGLSSSGRGIPLLHMLMPIVEVRDEQDGHSELRLVKPVHA